MNSLLDCHYLHEHNTHRFTCQKCMKPFPSRKARATHLQKDHKRVHPFPQWGTCSVCSWKGPGLAKHWKKEHPGQFGCGISKMVGLKKQDFFGQESTYSNENYCIL